MASHFVSITKGVDGEKYVDFTTGTGSSGEANGVELRIDDANTLRQTDVIKLIMALERFFANRQQWATAGFVING